VFRVLFAPLAKFLELYFALNFFLILAAPVIDPFAGAAGKFDKSFLRHDCILLIFYLFF